MSKFKPLLERPPKTNGLEIKLYAEASTSHLTGEDMRLLADDAAAGLDSAACREADVGYAGDQYLGVVDYQEGFVVWLGSARSKAYISGFLQGAREHGYSERLLEIIRRALEAGCVTLIFDQDGAVVDGLGTEE